MNKQNLSLRNNKILTIVIVLFLAVTVLFTIVKYAVNGNGALVKPNLVPGIGKADGVASPLPSVSSYNPPKEIKYDSSTNLKKELDSVDPVVSESDFKDL